MPKFVKKRLNKDDFKFVGGWHPSLPDHRDRQYEPPLMASLPASVDLRPQMPPVYDQGNIGSCTAQALGALLQYDEIKQNKGNKNTPSRLFIYYNERVLQNTINSDSGASMRTGIQSIVQWGFCDESLWAYDTTRYKNKPPINAYGAALPERVSHYSRLNQNLIQLKTTLVQGNPFVFGFSVYDPFVSKTVALNGILPMPSGRMLGGHAVLAVGYDDSHQAFIIRNSWGATWGLSGYFYMPYSYITNPGLAADFWVVQLVP
jgi:C1A family cysteine protease